MNRSSAPPEIWRPPIRGTFVQTDRATHEAWAKLSVKKPIAAGVMHYLAAAVGPQNAVVVPQRTIAKIIGVSDRSVRNAIGDLVAGGWIQAVKIGAGRECACVLNSRVAWSDKRDNLRLAQFSAEVIADFDDQPAASLAHQEPLHVLPSIFPDEAQLPSGPGFPPQSQSFLEGMIPDLPLCGRMTRTMSREVGGASEPGYDAEKS